MALNTAQRIQFVLSSMPLLVSEILKNLSARDLYRCSQVCKLWNSVVEEIKKQRCQIVTFMKGYHPEGPVEDSEEGIILRDCSNVGAQLIQWLQRSWSYPNVLIILASPDIFYMPERFFPEMLDFTHNLYLKEEEGGKDILRSLSYQRSEDFQLKTVMKYIKCHLPEKCQVLCCASKILVGTSAHSCPFMAYLNLQPLTALLLPPLAGAHLRAFTVSSPDFVIQGINVEYGVLQKCGLLDLSTDTRIRCIILFATSIENNCLNYIIDNALSKYKYEMIVGGDCENHATSTMDIFSNDFPFFSGLAFVGDNLQIHCVIVRQNYCCVRSQFECLKDCKMCEDNMVAFVFAEWPAQSLSFISALFHKFFPKVPLYGVMCRNLIFRDRLSIHITGSCYYCDNGIDETQFGLPFPMAAIIVFISFI